MVTWHSATLVACRLTHSKIAAHDILNALTCTGCTISKGHARVRDPPTCSAPASPAVLDSAAVPPVMRGQRAAGQGSCPAACPLPHYSAARIMPAAWAWASASWVGPSCYAGS
jgi:hypothetical protein